MAKFLDHLNEVFGMQLSIFTQEYLVLMDEDHCYMLKSLPIPGWSAKPSPLHSAWAAWCSSAHLFGVVAVTPRLGKMFTRLHSSNHCQHIKRKRLAYFL